MFLFWYTTCMSKPTISRVLEFQALLQQFSEVERALHRKHKAGYQFENDTEHSYNLTMTAWYLASFFPHLDTDLIIRYALVHDFLEIYSGDTFIFGSSDELSTQQDREERAIKELHEKWDDFPDLHHYIHEYETMENAESKFVFALDKFMPIMTMYVNDGYTWKTEHSSVKKIRDSRIAKVVVSEEIKPYFDELCEVLLDSPELLPPE